MKRVVLLVFLMFLWSDHAIVLASLAEVQALVKKVDARYLKTQDLQAEFSQETQIEGFDSRLSSSGRVLLKKPGLLRWDYQKPNVEQILVDGDHVMWYVPEHQQVVKGNLTQMSASKAPLTLLQGVGKLGEQFDITTSSDDNPDNGKLPIVVLVPKLEDQPTSTVTRIELTIEPTSHLIRQIVLYEKTGNISTLQFSNIRTNQGLDTNVLRLTMPDDVVVVDAPTM
ncbi:LolA family protein [Nitrospira sp. M1]